MLSALNRDRLLHNLRTNAAGCVNGDDNNDNMCTKEQHKGKHTPKIIVNNIRLRI